MQLADRIRHVWKAHAHLIIFLLFATFASLLLIFFLIFSYRQTQDIIKSSCRNEAHILASRMESALRRIRASNELVAENIIREALSSHSHPDQITGINQRLNALGRYFPEILGYIFFDPNGQAVFSSDAKLQKLNISDLLHFQQLKNNPSRGTIYFSETITTYSTQTRSIIAQQALLDSNNQFLGVIATPIDLHYFENLFAQIGVGREGMVSIRRSDNSTLVVRWPEVEAGLNKEARDIPPQLQIQAGIEDGVVRYVGRTDGVDRIFAFHKIPSFPFYVLIGRSVSEQFSGWKRMAVLTVLLSGVGLLLIGFFLHRLKGTSHKLRQSESQYQAIVESQRDAVCRWKPDTTLTYVNSTYKELYVSGDEKILGRQWIEFLPLKNRDSIKEKYLRIAQSPQIISTENLIPKKDGSYCYYHWVTIPIIDDNGNCIEFQSVGRDITERKKIEIDLRESEARTRAISDAAIDAIIMLGPSGLVTYWNPAAEKIFGYTGEEIIGKNLHQLIVPQRYQMAHDIAFAAFQNAGEGDAVGKVVELEACHKDGHEISVELSLSSLQNHEGWHAIGIVRDITERKQTLIALKESEERFKALHNASFGGIAIHDKGVILECNQGLSEISGYSQEELIGMDGLLLIAKNSRELVLNHIKSGYEKPYEAIGRRKNGEEYPLRLEARNIPYKGKNIRTVEFRDIAEFKHLESERDKMQNQLIQAQKMQSVGRLAGGVAHDFNNMLGVILGYSEMILGQIDKNQPIYHAQQAIHQAAQRSADLTKQLLAFARQQTVMPKVLNLNETVEGMLKMLGRLIGEDLDLAWRPGKDLGLVKIDPSQVDQVLANLCVNARDAIGDTGKITIETGNMIFDAGYCASHVDTLPGEYVMLAVSDNGCGMDEKTRSLIFEPFFSTKEMGKGTGLGLAMVYGIVKQNNGFINVYSEIGQGTSFKIYLPRYTSDAVHIPQAISTQQAATGLETILLVEDEVIILNMTTEMLNQLGYTVLPAKTPTEAQQLAQNHAGDINLLMTDVVMPEMNGRELARKLLSLYPTIKCLFMSGYTANVIAHHGVLDEGINFLQKPFSKQDLAAKIRNALDESVV